MVRIKDPRVSLPFYIDSLGMTLVHRMDSEGGKFTNYFLLYPQSKVPEDATERYRWMWSQQGIIEVRGN
jgi:lactoylglutathione lyase